MAIDVNIYYFKLLLTTYRLRTVVFVYIVEVKRHLFVPSLIFSRSMGHNLTYAIGDGLEIKPGTNWSPLTYLAMHVTGRLDIDIWHVHSDTSSFQFYP